MLMLVVFESFGGLALGRFEAFRSSPINGSHCFLRYLQTRGGRIAPKVCFEERRGERRRELQLFCSRFEFKGDSAINDS
eukprot:9036989-Pyramimonas_sp.AAC.1